MTNKMKFTGVVVLLCILYAGTWKFYSNKFEQHMEEQLVEIQAKGFDVSFDNMHISGFPFGYNVKVKNLEIKRGNVFKTWIDGDITFSAKLWKPQEISSVAGGTHHLEFDDFKAEGKGFVVRSFTFDPMRFEFFYDYMVITTAGKEFAKAKELEIDIDLTPKDGTDTASIRTRLEEFEAEFIKDSPLGPMIEHIILNASLKGKVEGDNNLDRVKNWYNNDGVLEVKELALKWGQTSATGDGTFSLDEDLQPLGAFSASFVGFDEAVDAYVKAGKLDKRKAGYIKSGIGLLQSVTGSKISITIQNKKLSIASVPVVQMPEITW